MTIDDVIARCEKEIEKLAACEYPREDMPVDAGIKYLPMERLPDGLDFKETVGGTTYVVNSYFDNNLEEDILKKAIRLMGDDTRKHNTK